MPVQQVIGLARPSSFWTWLSNNRWDLPVQADHSTCQQLGQASLTAMSENCSDRCETALLCWVSQRFGCKLLPSQMEETYVHIFHLGWKRPELSSDSLASSASPSSSQSQPNQLIQLCSWTQLIKLPEQSHPALGHSSSSSLSHLIQLLDPAVPAHSALQSSSPRQLIQLSKPTLIQLIHVLGPAQPDHPAHPPLGPSSASSSSSFSSPRQLIQLSKPTLIQLIQLPKPAH
jgi:hypothetical protein